jgi:hypothetical protein
MDKEEEKYVDAMFEMFRTKGWQMLMEDLSNDHNLYNSVEATIGNENLWFRKGQLDALSKVTSLEAQVESIVDEKDL